MVNKVPASKEFLDDLTKNTVCFVSSNRIDSEDAFIKNRFHCKQTGKFLGLIQDCEQYINNIK